MSPKTIVEGLVFPEGARWYQGKLWLSDMHAHRVLTVDAKGRTQVVAQFDDKPSGLGFLPDGTPLAVLMRKRQLVRFPGGKVSLHADLNSLPGHHLNDMVVDGQGRSYVGNRFPESPDTVVMVTPEGRMQTVAEGLMKPNGTAVTPDGRTMIVAESRGDCLTAFTVEKDGSLTGRRLFAKLDGLPDGICLDAEGAVWVGKPLQCEFIRVREGGEILQRISFPDGRWGITCALGDEDRKTLYMLTAFESHENMARMTDFQADLTSTSRGFVETLRVDVPGAGWP